MNTKRLLAIGITIEILLFAYCWFVYQPEIGEVFRYAARYSGRISLVVFLYCFLVFFNEIRQGIQTKNYKNLILLFAVLHLIHFYFLASNIYFNQIHLIPYRLAGGFLGYLITILYPYLLLKNKASKNLTFFYFFYLGIVFLLTYLSRIKGDFEGSTPSLVHYVGIFAAIVVIIVDGYLFILFRKKN